MTPVGTAGSSCPEGLPTGTPPPQPRTTEDENWESSKDFGDGGGQEVGSDVRGALGPSVDSGHANSCPA